jgi:DNA-binding transcriptional LysR family regulator
MELIHLQTFVVVAEEKSITQAAKRLFTTPSSISVQIKGLEDELGVQLFQRTARGMQITEKGEALLLKARHTLQSVTDLVNQATEMRAFLMGEVSLGLNASLSYLRVPKLLQILKAETPGISLNLFSSASGLIIEQILSEKLDVGFAFGEIKDKRLSSRRLETAELLVATPNNWGLEAANWQELSHHPWICSDYFCPFQEIIDKTFQEEGLSYQRLTTVNDDVSKVELVAAGLGLSLLERGEAEAYAAQGKLSIVNNMSFPCDLSLVFLSYRAHDALIANVIELIESLWQAQTADDGK